MQIDEVSLKSKTRNQVVCDEMLQTLSEKTLERWYPLAVDKEFGGYFTNLTYDFNLMPRQEKMIVTQARHIWTASKAAEFFGSNFYYDIAKHGFAFLKYKMWDSEHGGYFQIRNREGGLSEIESWFNEKRTYGNAFALYGLSALYKITYQEEILDLAKKTFNWIEDHSFDPKYEGYFQFLTHEGKLFDKTSEYKTKATDALEVGFKDQNSSIHLMEAYTEFYNVWKDNKLYQQLLGLLTLVRDVITDSKGYLRLFFEKDWTPVCFRNASKEEREANYKLDHVSFGHNYETAFLMLEASHALGLEDDTRTLRSAKNMIDHAIENGWDKVNGGFFDEGYYFEEDKCEIIKDTKNWWAQVEGLNALLLFSKIFPEEKRYYELFLEQWEYVKKYLIDEEYGDMYWGSLEKEPFYRTEPKGNIWKGTYHTGRALMNCIKMLSDEYTPLYRQNEKFRIVKNEFDYFILHWKHLAKNL